MRQRSQAKIKEKYRGGQKILSSPVCRQPYCPLNSPIRFLMFCICRSMAEMVLAQSDSSRLILAYWSLFSRSFL